MEDCLWLISKFNIDGSVMVLILVLMEDGLWRAIVAPEPIATTGLNPCFNGRWSLTLLLKSYRWRTHRLNPCFNGRWSLTICKRSARRKRSNSLNPCFNGRWSLTYWNSKVSCSQWFVLILVLMEDGLWQYKYANIHYWGTSLNPCFNGRWSLTQVCLPVWQRSVLS